MKNIPLLLATLIGTLAMVFGVAFFFGRATPPEIIDMAKLTANARHVVPAEADKTPEATASATPEATDQATTSPEKKVITIVEFSDMQCPACKVAVPIKDQLRAQYPGQIEFIFRHYPLLQIHPNAMLGAQAVEAAGNLNKFWEMHDLMFEKQEEWSELSNEEAQNKFAEYAVSLGMEKDPFTKEMNSDTVKTAVQSDINLGDEIKVSYTPTFFIDGKRVPASDVQSTVSQLLEN